MHVWISWRLNEQSLNTFLTFYLTFIYKKTIGWKYDRAITLLHALRSQRKKIIINTLNKVTTMDDDGGGGNEGGIIDDADDDGLW